MTPYEGIEAVPPGGYVRMSRKGKHVGSYWEFRRNESAVVREEEYVEEFSRLFGQAVRRRVLPGEKILAYLSGGYDSSLVVCTWDKIAKEEGRREVVDTLSYYDSNEPRSDDRKYFQKVIAQRGQAGFEFDLAGDGGSLSLMESEFAGAPGLSSRAEGRAYEAGLVRMGGYDAILCGSGGDELTGQVADPCVELGELLWSGRLQTVAKKLVEWSLAIRVPLVQLLIGAGKYVMGERWSGGGVVIGREWIDPRFARRHRVAPGSMRLYGVGGRGQGPVERNAYATIDGLARGGYAPPYSH